MIPSAPDRERTARRRPPPFARPRFGRRLARDREGATTIEFAFLAAPFLFMMFALIEIGILFVLDVALENATSQTARLVRTGQAHARAMDAGQFKTDVCGRMGVFESQCGSRLFVDVRVLPRFGGQTPPAPVDANGAFSESDLVFDIGDAKDIILVSAWYAQPIVTPMVSQGTERFAGQRTLNSTTAFRNEPF